MKNRIKDWFSRTWEEFLLKYIEMKHPMLDKDGDPVKKS